MRRLQHLWRFRIRRLYWIRDEDATHGYHTFPNRDLMRHEATDCWCGPNVTLEHCEPDVDCWHYEHHSLDAREGRTR